MNAANDNRKTAQFEIGKTYSCRSICDYECIFSFEVIARTERTVTIKSGSKTVRRKVRISGGVETIDPHGRYSMSPVLRAA